MIINLENHKQNKHRKPLERYKEYREIFSLMYIHIGYWLSPSINSIERKYAKRAMTSVICFTSITETNIGRTNSVCKTGILSDRCFLTHSIRIQRISNKDKPNRCFKIDFSIKLRLIIHQNIAQQERFSKS